MQRFNLKIASKKNYICIVVMLRMYVHKVDLLLDVVVVVIVIVVVVFILSVVVAVGNIHDQLK